MLRSRIGESSIEEAFIFNKRCKEVIAEIHYNWQTYNDLRLPKDEDLLLDLDITEETMRSMDIETMQELLLNLVLADSTLFFKFLYSQGYDLWLT